MSIARAVVVVCLCSVSPVAAQEDAAPPPDTFVATPAVAGPEATLEAACAAEDTTCKPKKLNKKPKLVAPYLGLGLVERTGYESRETFLGIQTDAGWHLFELNSWGTAYGGTGSLKLRKVAIRDVVPGGAPEIVLTGTRKQSNESSSYTIYGTTEELLWVCSVGASGAPSCAEVLLAIDFKPSDFDVHPPQVPPVALVHQGRQAHPQGEGQVAEERGQLLRAARPRGVREHPRVPVPLIEVGQARLL